MAVTYLAYPGNGRTSPTENITFIDAASVASLYGLSAGEYTIAGNTFTGTQESVQHINLRPRQDGLYVNIKNALGDNGTDYHYDTFPSDKHRKNGGRYGVKRYYS